jgi:transcription-repair coupling factor (superfamily II helicase)
MVDLHIEGSFGIPTDSVPEPAIRLEIYDRVAKARTQAAIDALADEFEDRFGAPAAPTQALFERARIQISARALGICRIDAGPVAIALSFRSGLRKYFKTIPGTRREGDRLIRPRENDVAQGARILTETLNFIELVEQAQPGPESKK